MTTFIILIFILILSLGFGNIAKRLKNYHKKCDFANEYRNNFIEFCNTYYSTYEKRWNPGTIDGEKYMWLTKNVNRIQGNLGQIGVMDYVAPFRTMHVKNYQIVINTLPKFRDGNVQDFDINSVDDCLLRYIGNMEELINQATKKIRNPIVWFQEGFKQLISLPIYILNWFGIVPERTLNKVISNGVYNIFIGIGGLVAFISGVVTIIQGKQQLLEYIYSITTRQ